MKKKQRIKIKNNKKLLVFTVILAVLIVLIAVFISKQEKIECKNDADCVKQQTTCCNCNMGGIEKCMSRKNASYWQEKLGECEKNIMCIALYNCKDTSCKCAEGECTEE